MKHENFCIYPPARQYPSSTLEKKYQEPHEGPFDEKVIIDILETLENLISLSSDDTNDYNSFILEDFSIYSRKEDDFKSIIRLLLYQNVSHLLVDGYICEGTTRYRAERIPVIHLSIGNVMGSSQDIVDKTYKSDLCNAIWIKSTYGNEKNFWYSLGKPSKEYEPYWKPSYWIMLFAKYFADYLIVHERLTLEYFRCHFCDWLQTLHRGNKNFKDWLSQCPRNRDLRQAVASYMPLLHHFIHTINHNINWAEVHPVINQTWPGAFEKCPTLVGGKDELFPEPTIVTPYIFRRFKHLYSREMLQMQENQDFIGTEGKELVVEVTKPQRMERTVNGMVARIEYVPGEIKVGDVVAIKPDKGSSWNYTDIWMGYVQTVQNIHYKDKLGIIWLYAAKDTHSLTFDYINKSEASNRFWSNNCNCDQAPLFHYDVLAKVPVHFGDSPEKSGCEYFVRFFYHTDTFSFSTLKASDMDGVNGEKPCGCTSRNSLESMQKEFPPNTHVLFMESELDPYLSVRRIESYEFENKIFTMRVFQKRSEILGEPLDCIEVYWTCKVLTYDFSHFHRINRKCTVIYLGETQPLTPELLYHGAGDFWFCRRARSESGKLGSIAIDELDSHSIPECNKLSGLDLFCGGGNFARGFSDTGAVKFKWAVDIDAPALKTYEANIPPNEDVYLYHGSVNTFLASAITGKQGNKIPHKGEVDLIIAGSPCQGFSLANADRTTEKSVTNCSLVASVGAFVDYYRPKFFVLENVPQMNPHNSEKDPTNVFKLLMSAAVGLGYQIRGYHLTADSHGGCQERTRLFIVGAAPGLELPQVPPWSHWAQPVNGAPPKYWRLGLGRDVVGNLHSRTLPEDVVGAYPRRSISSAMANLPNIYDGHIQICVSHPLHIVLSNPHEKLRRIASCIPRFTIRDDSTSLSYNDAVIHGRITPSLRWPSADEFNASTGGKSKAFRRCKSDEPSCTITTHPVISSNISGRYLHYDQPRCLSIEEAKICQGFFDSDVFIGRPSDVMRIIGNSVERHVAFSIGKSILDAYQSSMHKEPFKVPLCRSSATGGGTRVTRFSMQDEDTSSSTSTLRYWDCQVGTTDKKMATTMSIRPLKFSNSPPSAQSEDVITRPSKRSRVYISSSSDSDFESGCPVTLPGLSSTERSLNNVKAGNIEEISRHKHYMVPFSRRKSSRKVAERSKDLPDPVPYVSSQRSFRL